MGGGSGPTPSVSVSATPSVAEIGSSVPSVILDWVILNTVAASQVITGTGISGSISIAPGLTTCTVGGPFVSDGGWSLLVNGLYTATASLVFDSRRYWGTSALVSLANVDILSLPSALSGGQDFGQSDMLEVFYDCTGGAYPYFCYPTAFGKPSNVEVGGLSFTSFSVTPQSFTNASGYTTAYNVLRFLLLQTGASIKTDWQ